MMKFVEQDILHTQWMLEYQIDSPGDLIHFWVLNGPLKCSYPSVERCRPIWYHDLPEVTTYVRKRNRKA